MRTRMTELFEIRYPIMLAGMNWLTTPKLVAAVSNAGGLGVLAVTQYEPDQLKKALQEIRAMTNKPFGINIISDNEMQAKLEIIYEEKVPVVNYSLAHPPEIQAMVQAVHSYGGKVVGTVAMTRHAKRSEQLGVDALVVTSYEAAAHSGNVGALVLIPQVSEAVKVPCIAAGGNTDGKGLAAALALGAEGVSMGTRLASTQEAEIADVVKQTWLKATEEDTVIDPAFDGINCRALRNKAVDKMLKKQRLAITDAFSAAMMMKKEMDMTWLDLIKKANSFRKGRSEAIGGNKLNTKEVGSLRGIASAMRFAVGINMFYKATKGGDPINGILLAGQAVGRIHDIPTVADIMERTVAEAKDIILKMSKQLAD